MGASPGWRRRSSSGASGRAASRAQLVTGLVPVAAGTVAYALLTRVLRVGEAEVLWRMVRERLARRT